jgi:hypothetical protein
MTRTQALSAVHHEKARHLLDLDLATRIVQFVAAERASPTSAAMEPGMAEAAAERGDEAPEAGEIEPALLSLFCRGLNERRKRADPPRARIDAELLETAKQGIIADYYRSCIGDLPDTVSRFIESELITEKGYRNSFAKEDAVPRDLTNEQLSRLVKRRLLRVEDRQGTQRIELTHDLLTRTVREHRDWRRAEEERREAARRAEAERVVLARRAEEERAALEAHARERERQLEDERRAERERRLEAEVRSARRIKRVAAALALALLGTVAMSVVAWWQWRTAQGETRRARTQADLAERARREATAQRQLAEARLDRILRGIQMKEAVLSGDRARLDQALQMGPVNTTLAFRASARPLGYRDGANRPIFRCDMFPDPGTVPNAEGAIIAVTYTMDHPTFRNNKFIAGPERAFTATYDGWGCVTRVVALIEYANPNRSPEVTSFNLCELLSYGVPAPAR